MNFNEKTQHWTLNVSKRSHYNSNTSRKYDRKKINYLNYNHRIDDESNFATTHSDQFFEKKKIRQKKHSKTNQKVALFVCDKLFDRVVKYMERTKSPLEKRKNHISILSSTEKGKKRRNPKRKALRSNHRREKSTKKLRLRFSRENTARRQDNFRVCKRSCRLYANFFKLKKFVEKQRANAARKMVSAKKKISFLWGKLKK